MENESAVSSGPRRGTAGSCLFLTALTLLVACGEQEQQVDVTRNLAVAEAFVDAFYSWDADALQSTVISAPEDAASVLYYQAWAEAGNYQVQTRRACEISGEGQVKCAITVTDDIGGALGYIATDTFHLFTHDGVITGVTFTSDDPPVFEALFGWLQESRPEVFAGPCKDLFAGGPTPADCVRAVVQGAQDFAALQQAQ